MGVIYKARQLLLDKLVAIKMVHTHLVSSEAFQRFQLEGKASALLKHENIIAVLVMGVTENGQPFMIMDYVDGKTLAQILGQENTLSTRDFSASSNRCARVSPTHTVEACCIGISNQATSWSSNTTPAKKTFGLWTSVSQNCWRTPSPNEHLTKTGEAVGSPLDMSPEQARGNRIDARTDLYSLGCVMYECLVGTPPFLGKTQLDTMLMHMNDAPAPLRHKARNPSRISPALESVVMALLKKNPNNRYQSMD